MVLKTLRRIFPFQSVIHHDKKPCLYNHLGLCPCPYVYDTKEMEENYNKNIKRIKKFLRGEIKGVEKDLIKDRDNYAKKEDFEKAQELQRKILAIKTITEPVVSPLEYDINPNLKDDLREKELHSLREILNEYGIGVENLERIECYDISTITGKHSTASMVVFTHGEKDTSSYRRFRIRLKYKGPNDFLMMEETLSRRFSNESWPKPGLIIVDGGKGQVSSALKVLNKFSLRIPLIGLAKREETIITPDLKSISLPKSSSALKLIMRIRDEAHRFAISYHRKLRSSYFLSTSNE